MSYLFDTLPRFSVEFPVCAEFPVAFLYLFHIISYLFDIPPRFCAGFCCVCVCVRARARVCVCVHTHTTTHTDRHKYTHGHLFVSLHFVPYGTERERGREGERDADTCSYRLISSLMASAPFLEARACILLSIIASQSLYCLVYVCVCVCVCVRIYVYSNTYIRVFIMANQRP